MLVRIGNSSIRFVKGFVSLQHSSRYSVSPGRFLSKTIALPIISPQPLQCFSPRLPYSGRFGKVWCMLCTASK